MSTALQTPQSAPRDIRALIASDKVKQQIRLALPTHMSPDRMMRVALTAVNKTPKLLECTQESILSCLMQCSQYGVEPDGRHAHLIPYGNQCTLILDYKGIIALVRRSGEVTDIYADVVCENDLFGFHKGKDRKLTHSYDLRKPRGAVIGAYSYVVPKEGADSFEIMSVDEIEAIRARSRSGKAGPWVSDWNEMAKKTVFRRHSKWLPFSPELQESINQDSDVEIDITPAAVAPRPVFAPTPALPPAAATPAPEPPAQSNGQTPPEDDLPMGDTPAPAAAPVAETASETVPAAEPPLPVVGTPRTPRAKKPPEKGPKELLLEAGVQFDDFTDWLVNSGRNAKAKEWAHTGNDRADYDLISEVYWRSLAMDGAGIAKCVVLYGKTAPEVLAVNPE